MEPKNPIVIDGVDVNGCEYCLKMTKCRCTIQQDVYKCLCEENPNCHYKQLQRKERENQRYEQTLIAIEDIAKDMNVECFYSDFECEDCDMKNGCIHQGRLKILQIIREVTNE